MKESVTYQAIVEEGEIKAESDVLYRYSPLAHFLRIVQTRTLWLTDLFSTNDKSEHRMFRKIAAEAIKEELKQPSRGYDEATMSFWPGCLQDHLTIRGTSILHAFQENKIT